MVGIASATSCLRQLVLLLCRLCLVLFLSGAAKATPRSANRETATLRVCYLGIGSLASAPLLHAPSALGGCAVFFFFLFGVAAVRRVWLLGPSSFASSGATAALSFFELVFQFQISQFVVDIINLFTKKKTQELHVDLLRLLV